jgi:TPR repeat protein
VAEGVGTKRDPLAALALFDYAVSLGNDDALFSAGLACATMDPPDFVKAATYARISMSLQPDGKGGGLLEKLAPMMTDAERDRSRAAADEWTRPKATNFPKSLRGL